MFDTVLVADRGLLACRVVRTCQRLGARAVTVHATADVDRLHAQCADESLLLGPSDEAATYLDGLKVIEAAGQAGAQAVHPGGGVLARSAAFAHAVQDAGLTWVGPPPAALAAAAQASAAGAAPEVLVTVLAPPDGPVAVLADGSRSAGRASAPAALPDDVRARAWTAAAEAVDQAGLVGLVQVALAPSRGLAPSGLHPWLTLDHPVVELVTGVDLVEQQLLLAAGKATGPDAAPGAHGAAALLALRARTGGHVTDLSLPEGDGLRVEAGFREGEQVAPADGLLVTVAAWGETDGQARERLAAARDRLVVDGIELEEDQWTEAAR